MFVVCVCAGEASQSSSSLQLDPERDETFSVNTEAGQEPEAKFMSIILTNLQVNYEGWKAELPKEEDEEEKDEVNDDKVSFEEFCFLGEVAEGWVSTL